MNRLFLFVLIIFSKVVFSQSGTNDVSFISQHTNLYGDGSAFDGEVVSIVLQPDGKAILGGSFTTYNGVSRNGLVRVHPDGSIDTGFEIFGGFNVNSGSISINEIAVQSDGKIIVGGVFDVYNGTVLNNIARLNPDGSLDQSFVSGTGFGPVFYFSRSVNAIGIQTDGKIIVGGDFYEYNGSPAANIVRLNEDGTIDPTFNSGSGFDGYVNSVIVNSAGKILVGGAFSNYNGTSTNCLIQLNGDGSVDPIFNIGSGPDGIIKTLAIQSDGALLVGGNFSNFNGINRNKITRLNPTGSNDAMFNIGSGIHGASLPTVNKIVIQQDGKIGVAGLFSSFNGNSSNSMALINPNGSFFTGFNGFTGVNGEIRDVIIQPDGKYLIGGAFDLINSIPFNKNCRLNANGTLDITYNLGMGVCGQGITYVNTSCVTDDGKTLIGGRFKRVNGRASYNISRLNFDGTTDTTFNTGTGFNDQVMVVINQPDGKYLVGGFFTSFNGVSRNGIARLNSNGSLDLSFNPGSGVFGTNDPCVYSIKVLPSEKILIGGDFTSFNGSTANRIVRLNSNGTIDGSFVSNLGFNDWVADMLIQPDDKIVVGGSFTDYNGLNVNSLVRLNPNGSHDPTFDSGSGILGTIFCMEIQSDGKILVGGMIAEYNGNTANNLVRLNPDGSQDQSFSIGQGFDNYIRDILLTDDGKMVISGAFSHINGYYSPGCGRLESNGSRDLTFSNSSSELIVNTANLFPDGRLFIGGDFLAIGTDSRNRIGRLLECELTNYSVTACNNYTWPINGQTYTSSGIYQDTIPVWYGCDSIIFLNLTIIQNQVPLVQNTFSLPTDTISCLGSVYCEVTGNLDFEFELNNTSQLINSNSDVLFDTLCPGIHNLTIRDNCGDSLSTYVVVPTFEKYFSQNIYNDSIPLDSLGKTYSKCEINYNELINISIDTFWRVANDVHVKWEINGTTAIINDTVLYTTDGGEGVYLMQLNLYCNDNSRNDYVTATEAIYIENSGLEVNNNDQYYFQIFPNPVTSKMKIQVPEIQALVQIFDLSGKVLHEYNIQNGEEISISNLSSGAYLVIINSGVRSYTGKIIKH